MPWTLEEPETWEEEWKDTLDDIRAGGVFLAEDGEGALGVARIEAPVARARARPDRARAPAGAPARRREGAAARVRADAHEQRRGVRQPRRADGQRTGAGGVVAARLRGARQVHGDAARRARARGSRTSDRASRARRPTCRPTTSVSVERAVAQFVPRLEAPEVQHDRRLDPDRRPASSTATATRTGGSHASSPTGSAPSRSRSRSKGEVVRFRLYERGRMVDEYLSVPTWYGELPKGDELALAANPTLVVAPHRRRRATRCGASRARRRRRRSCRRPRSSTSRSRG